MGSEHIELLAVPIFPEILSELILLDTEGEIMDENEFKQRASRLEKIAKVVEKLPSEIRAAAFDRPGVKKVSAFIEDITSTVFT